MRRPTVLFAVFLLAAAVSAEAATGRVMKVLPHFLDQKGRHTLSPSLYDRDAYQAHLRAHPEERSGIRFDVRWKARGDAPLKLRVELRGFTKGEKPRERTLETEIKPGWFSHWNSLPFTGEEFQTFGDVSAWRATLWEGDRLLGEQKSFLW